MGSECQWEDLLFKIDDMMDSGEFDWASDTLEGIYEWVKENEHCTPAQAQAIENIAAHGS